VEEVFLQQVVEWTSMVCVKDAMKTVGTMSSSFKFLSSEKKVNLEHQIESYGNSYILKYEGPSITLDEYKHVIRLSITLLKNRRPYDDTDLVFIMMGFKYKLDYITGGNTIIKFKNDTI